MNTIEFFVCFYYNNSMKLGIQPQISFKSDYYGFKKMGTFYWMTSIKTDDPPEENKELLIREKDYKGKIHGDFPMIYDGKYYTYKFPYVLCLTGYEILNKKNKEGEKEINEFEISRILNTYDRITTGKPAEKIFSKGSTQGLLVTDLNKIPEDKPVIVMIDKLENSSIAYDTISSLPQNVFGIVLNNALIADLSHAGTKAREYYELVSIVYEDKKYNELKTLVGKNITISNENGKIEYSIIDRLPALADLKPPTPHIPTLDEETKFLDFSELTRKNSGEKAYRLGVMQKLAKDGYLSDVEIPQGFVIPTGYINKIYEYLNNAKNKDDYDEKLFNHPMNEELVNVCQRYGLIDKDGIVIRSSFNAEDLPDYQTAGIYDSSRCYDYGDLFTMLHSVVISKDALPARMSRKRYGIPDSAVQPCIIVQNFQYTDFPFTLYTDTSDGKLKLEMLYRDATCGKYSDNAIITYDRNSDKITLESTQNTFGDYLIKDTGEVIEQHLKEDEIEKNWASLLAPLGIVIKNALKLEKYFGRPQDIEGGIHNGKVYFWQTRDIVKKVVRKK